MPRYEFKEGGSSKFWEISLSGSTFTTRWGKIGGAGQEKTQEFDSPAEAVKEAEKLIREKERKGYELVKGGGEAGMTVVEPASNPELEAAILAAPEDVKAYLAYGDWLRGEGEPRGELIALHHAVMEATGAAIGKAHATAQAFIDEHAAELLGDLAEAVENEEVTLDWHLGFIREARVGQKDYDSTLNVAETLKTLLAHPSARFLQSLTVGMASFDGENEYEGVIEALVESRGSKTLRSFFLGDFEYPDETEISWTQVGDLSPLYKLMPNLRDLRVRGGSVELGKIDLPELREFTVETGGLPLSAVKSIAKAKWPKLEALEVWFGSDNYGAEGGVKDLRPILDGEGLPNLKKLRLRNSEFTDALCEALPDAKILPRLQQLDLSMGTMTVVGARALAERAAAFKHLESLDVSDNFLSAEAQKLVANLCPHVAAGSQRGDEDEEYRYASVGE